MSVTLFGGLNINIPAGSSVPPLTRKAKHVLAILCLFEGQGVSRASLAEWVWPDRSEGQARSSLRQALSALRKLLTETLPEHAIGTHDDKLVLTGPVKAIDTCFFEQLAGSESPDDWAAAAALYRGDVLDGVELPERMLEIVVPIRTKFRQRALDLVERLSSVEDLAAAGRTACEDLANCLLTRDAAAEEAHRAIMRLRLSRGQINAARRQLDFCIDAVRRELGAEPETATLRLIDTRSAADDSTAGAIVGDHDTERTSSSSDTARFSESLNNDHVFRRPAVLFLPFEALSSSADDALLASGLCEDIRTTLACWRSFPVIGPEALGNETGDVQQLAAHVDAAYAVSGSVRRAGNRARVVARLIDVGTARELWSETFDGDLEDVFDFQEDVSRRIVSQIEPELVHAAAVKIPVARPKDLTTWELLAKAVDAERRGGDGYGTQEANVAQKTFVAAAIERDPTSCEAWARLARCQFRDFLLGWTDDRDQAIEDALEASARAVEINPQNSLARAMRAQSILFGKHDPTGALDQAQEAVRSNPSNVAGHVMMGCVLVYCGDPERAFDHYETVLRLNPAFSNKGAVFCDQMMCRALVGDLEHAVQLARKTMDIAPKYYRGLQRCAAVLAHAGMREEAALILQRIEEIGGSFSETYIRETYPFVRSQDVDFFLDGLRKAGWTG